MQVIKGWLPGPGLGAMMLFVYLLWSWFADGFKVLPYPSFPPPGVTSSLHEVHFGRLVP